MCGDSDIRMWQEIFSYLVEKSVIVFLALFVFWGVFVLLGKYNKKKFLKFLSIFFLFFIVILFFPRDEVIDKVFYLKTSINCNGEIYSVCDNYYCEKRKSDFGKECTGNEDCEGYCEFENAVEIRKVFCEKYADLKEYDLSDKDYYYFDKAISREEWYRDINITLSGKCSEYPLQLYSGSFRQSFIVDGDVFKFACHNSIPIIMF